jgi:hypothetical protein
MPWSMKRLSRPDMRMYWMSWNQLASEGDPDVSCSAPLISHVSLGESRIACGDAEYEGEYPDGGCFGVVPEAHSGHGTKACQM